MIRKNNNNRLELANKLQEIEERKHKLLEQYKAVASPYCEEVHLRLSIETRDFEDKGIEDDVKVDIYGLKEYLQTEINSLTVQSKDIVQELTGVEE